jgi:hypothetical protein
MNPGMSMRMTTFSIVSLLTMFLIRYLGQRWQMPELIGWKHEANLPPTSGSLRE